MSKVVSFRCSEELDEFLKQEAEERMTTKSTVAQMLVAERVRQLKDGSDDEEIEAEETAADQDDLPDETDDDEGELPPIFEKYSDKWFTRGDDYDHNFSVRVPREGREPDYYQYQTVEHAANRLRKEFED